MSSAISQAGLPRGLIGRIVGRIMAWRNRPDNEWTISLLEINNSENILEVGFGPGQAIQLLSDVNASVHIAGIDHSETMLASARQLNEGAIAAGRVNLQLGSAEHLPFADSTFDKAFSINCIYFWKEPLQGLRELHRVLKPSGHVAVTVRDKEQKAYQAFRPDKLTQLFAQAGFFSVSVHHNGVRSHPLICVVAAK